MESIKQPNLALGAAEFVRPTRAAASEILCPHVRLRCDFHIILPLLHRNLALEMVGEPVYH
jgi:hypothetical protein